MATESETPYCYNTSKNPRYFLCSSAYLTKIKVYTRPLCLYYSYRTTGRRCMSFSDLLCSLPDTLWRSPLKWKLPSVPHLREGRLPRRLFSLARPLSSCHSLWGAAPPLQWRSLTAPVFDFLISGGLKTLCDSKSVRVCTRILSPTPPSGSVSSMAKAAIVLLLNYLLFKGVFTPITFDPAGSASTVLKHNFSSQFLWLLRRRHTHTRLRCTTAPSPAKRHLCLAFSPSPQFGSFPHFSKVCKSQGGALLLARCQKIPNTETSFRGLQQTPRSPWLLWLPRGNYAAIMQSGYPQSREDCTTAGTP